MGRTYLIVLLVAGVIGSMLTSGGSRTESGTDDFDAQVERNEHGLKRTGEASAASSSFPWADSLELERESDGHFYADVEINGRATRMLVDTGATAIALSRSDARRAGIAVSIGMPEVVGKGASGDVRGEYVLLERVALGQKTAEDIPAVTLDSGELSLLGQGFLSRFDSVVIQGDTMVLH